MLSCRTQELVVCGAANPKAMIEETLQENIDVNSAEFKIFLSIKDYEEQYINFRLLDSKMVVKSFHFLNILPCS